MSGQPAAFPVHPLGVVLYAGGYDVSPLLAEVCAALAARGDLRIGGVLPVLGEKHANGRHSMHLRDIGTGQATPISQELGALAEGCILDSDGLMQARQALTKAIESGADLVILGKFAKQEAAGQGIRPEIAQAVEAGIPALVVMRENQREAFEAFAGDDWAALPPEPNAVLGWALAATGRAGA